MKTVNKSRYGLWLTLLVGGLFAWIVLGHVQNGPERALRIALSERGLAHADGQKETLDIRKGDIIQLTYRESLGGDVVLVLSAAPNRYAVLRGMGKANDLTDSFFTGAKYKLLARLPEKPSTPYEKAMAGWLRHTFP